MAVTPATLKTKFAEFASVNDSDLQPWIDEAELNVCRATWGDRADDGVSYLAAHLFVVFGDGCFGGQSGDAPGPVERVKVDQLETEFTVGDVFANEDLGTTKYGRRFISIRELLLGGCRLV